jgi:large subunit ribosomal protein L4
MPIVDVFSLENEKVGAVELTADVYGAEVNTHLLYEAVRHYMAGQRAGTAKTKSRWEVAGSGKKLWKQKGTGRARMGSIRSPLWRKGGTVHGPKPRDYSYRLNKKMIQGALRSALSGKLRDGEMTVVRSFELAGHKTKLFRVVLERFGFTGKVLLVDVVGEGSRNLILASRNLPDVKLSATHEVTAYDLLSYQNVLITEAAALRLGAALGSVKSEKEAA